MSAIVKSYQGAPRRNTLLLLWIILLTCIIRGGVVITKEGDDLRSVSVETTQPVTPLGGKCGAYYFCAKTSCFVQKNNDDPIFICPPSPDFSF